MSWRLCKQLAFSTSHLARTLTNRNGPDAERQVLISMDTVSQSQLTFESGGKQIRLDCFLPARNGPPFPAVIGLHGSGGSSERMAEPARLLAAYGFVSTYRTISSALGRFEPTTRPPSCATLSLGRKLSGTRSALSLSSRRWIQIGSACWVLSGRISCAFRRRVDSAFRRWWSFSAACPKR